MDIICPATADGKACAEVLTASIASSVKESRDFMLNKHQYLLIFILVSHLAAKLPPISHLRDQNYTTRIAYRISLEHLEAPIMLELDFSLNLKKAVTFLRYYGGMKKRMSQATYKELSPREEFLKFKQTVEEQTAKALKSKASARKMLIDSGIFTPKGNLSSKYK